ncbi:MAG: outer membrane beta-barrel protein [Kofleriaceae bacterium]|nr:outer membrane beta-barrel protein [Myxococcales bacterium]MCB9558798.1 outer membrane beta-barrel protein [Kofleriaceae bacterium]MCB9570648.1 outer membrane beta-barrel protein [Kofleriaceae bacterium]
MRTRLSTIMVAGLVAGTGLAARDAAAEPVELWSEYGASITAGGGVEGFTAQDARDVATVNGLWGVNVAVGTREYLGIEASYLGSAAPIDSPVGNVSATLYGTTVEAVARANLMPTGALDPYVFAGAGWRRYDVSENFKTSDVGMNDSDNLFVVPVGVGLAYRYQGFVADARLSMHIATNQDLILENAATDRSSTSFAAMHTWGAAANLGYEF